MAITKQKKVEITERLREIIAQANSLVFVHFTKLSVAETAALRKELSSESVGYFVAKKSLIKRALAEKGIDGTMPEMPGEIALVWSTEDATAAARGIYEAGKKHKGSLTIEGGVFEDAFKDANGMLAIATIPPVPVLRGMFVNVINSPIQSMVIALDAIAKQKAA